MSKSKSSKPYKSDKTAKNKELMLEALEKTMGIVTQALTLTSNHISRETHYTWLETDLKYRAKVESVNEKVIDMGENALFQLIKEKNPSTVQFFMKTKGRKRGYQEKVEITGNDGGPILTADVSKMTDQEIDEYLKARLSKA